MEIISRREAKLSGLDRYFTGDPCKWRHIAERYVNFGGCVVCAFARAREWDKTNPTKKSANRREWKRNNPEKVRAQERTLYSKDRDRIRAVENKRRKEKAEHYRKTNRARYNANPEPLRASHRKWSKNNPIKTRALNNLRRSRKKSAEGKFSAAEIEIIRKLQRNRCAEPTCRKKLNKSNEQIDHIVPLAKGGTNWPNNIQLLCAKCNLAKHDTDPLAHAKRLGRFI